MKRMCLLAAMLALFSAVSTARAGEKLSAGDPAPPLNVGKWFNGEPVTAFEKGKIYVVECWATWCGPCRQTIPHLSEMNTKLKDKGVTFIGVDVLEDDESGVESFIKEMGEKMNYRVAIDKPAGEKGHTAVHWMRAARQNGIPCAFVVDKEGNIAWIGHPMAGLDKVLDHLIDGTFVPPKEAARNAKKKVYEDRLMEAYTAQKFDEALAIIAEFEKADPLSEGQNRMMKFNILLREKHDEEGAYKIARGLPEGKIENEESVCNLMAWAILDTADLKNRDLDLAMKLAVRADTVGNHQNPNVLETLARAHFEKGDKAKAVEIQTLAVEKAPDARKNKFRKALVKYQTP